MIISKETLSKAVSINLPVAAIWVDALNKVLVKYDINTNLRISHFLAQVCHECGKFSVLEENLNYKAESLVSVFPKYFTNTNAPSYAHNKIAIGNRVYANRMGNGNEASGDGYKYRGRGCIQITGKSQYDLCGTGIGLNLLKSPDLLTTPINALMSAGWFWDKHNLNVLADKDDINSITKVINGGLNGIDDRTSLLNNCKKILK